MLASCHSIIYVYLCVIIPGLRPRAAANKKRRCAACPLRHPARLGRVGARPAGPAAVVWLFVRLRRRVNDCVTRLVVRASGALIPVPASGGCRLRGLGFSGRLPRHHAGAAFFYWADCLPFYYICVSLRHHTRSCIQRSRLRVVGVDVFGDRLADIAQGYLTLGFFLKSNDVSSHFFFPVMAMTNRNMRLSYTFF